MIRKLIHLAVLIGPLAALTGCCCGGRSMMFFPFTDEEISRCDSCGGGSCGGDSCGCDDCGTSCGRSCGRPCAVRPRVAACESCGDCGDGGSCGSCDSGCGRFAAGPPCGPLTWLVGLFNCRSYPGCGCAGQRYWGDFYDPSSRPDLCDPCDCHGNYTGPAAVRMRGEGVYESAPPAAGGCKSCQGHASTMPRPKSNSAGAYVAKNAAPKSAKGMARPVSHTERIAAGRPAPNRNTQARTVARTAPKVVSDRAVGEDEESAPQVASRKTTVRK